VTSVLIGHTGFVGGLLARRTSFDLAINRANLDELRNREVERVVCAGLPAAKWLANRDPAADRDNVRRLCDVLDTVTTRRFVLISTIDVYPRARDADEGFDPRGVSNHSYGTHRLQFETFVRHRFPDALIIRLPALFGPGLRKNVLFDLLHGNQLDLINPDSHFQWYPLERLPNDIELAEAHRLRLVNLFTEPVATREILERFFPDAAVGARPQPAAHYDLQTRHAALFGGQGRYRLSAVETLTELGKFCRSAAVHT
jgi:hypothetical protein